MANKLDRVYSGFNGGHLGRTKNNPRNNEQALIEHMYIRLFTELCSNRFKWVGLPNDIDERFLELSLFWHGGVGFYFDHDFDKYLVARFANLGPLNHYDNPTQFWVTLGPSNQPKMLGPRQLVPIWANYMRMPDLDIVTTYAKRLAATDRSLEIAAKNMRRPKIVAASENARQSVQNFARQVDNGEEWIFTVKPGVGQESLSDMVTVLDLGAEVNSLTELRLEKSKLWNECMGYLGINNANQDKKERLVEAEVSANDDQVNATRNIAMNSRLQACSQINHMFEGLTLDVKFNQDVTQMQINPEEGYNA